MYRVQKKRRGFLYIILLFCFAFLIGAGLGYGGVKMGLFRTQTEAVLEDENPARTREEKEEENKAASLNVVLPQEEENPERYFVKEVEGDVCVFRLDEHDEKIFSHKLSVELNSLKEADRALFRAGIEIHSKQELLEFTEDFSS